VKKALLCLAIGLLLVTAASFGAGAVWLLELTTHFRPHLATAAGLLLLCAILSRYRAGAILAFVALAVNAIPLWPYVDISAYASAPPVIGTERHRLLHFNMQHRHAHLAGLKTLIEQEQPDFVLLTEVPATAHEMIEALRGFYPHVSGLPGGSLFEVVLLSRVAPRWVNIDRAAGARHPVLAAELCPSGPDRCLRIVSLHAAAPLLPGWAAVRNHQLTLAAGYTRDAANGRTLLVGDLNLTPWSPFFARLKRDGQLTDSGLGRGLVGTWESPLPFLGLIIDHVLTGPRVIALERRLGEDLASDHRPLIVDFAVQ